MQWLRRCTLVVSIGLGVSVLALVIHTFWMASQSNPPLLGQRVQDLQILVIILLALSSLYTVVFLLSPSVSDRILRRQADQTVKAVKTQMTASIAEMRELKEEFRRIMLGNEKLLRQIRSEGPALQIHIAEKPEETAPSLNTAPPTAGRDYAQVPARPQPVDHELATIYQALANPHAKPPDSSAKAYLTRAIGRTSDPAKAADLHYTLGCLLARNGDLEEALREIQMAFLNKSPDLDQKLAQDIEEGGPLFELANREPSDQVLLDLLMDVSVGA